MWKQRNKMGRGCGDLEDQALLQVIQTMNCRVEKLTTGAVTWVVSKSLGTMENLRCKKLTEEGVSIKGCNLDGNGRS